MSPVVECRGPGEPVWRRFVAVGDSFPEGVGDRDPGLPNGVRGWADRVAGILARQTGGSGPPLTYANLAVRGKLLDGVVADQLPAALGLRPDLATICAGVNDMLRPGVDIDDVMARYDEAIGALADTGATVFTFTAFDTVDRPLFSAMRGRFAIYNELLREVAERRNAVLVDFWRMREFSDRRMWDFDRMHLSPSGHRQMAIRVAEALGVAHDLVPERFGPAPVMSGPRRRAENRRWVTREAVPWIGRRMRGVSRGDAMTARYPEPVEVSPGA